MPFGTLLNIGGLHTHRTHQHIDPLIKVKVFTRIEHFFHIHIRYTGLISTMSVTTPVANQHLSGSNDVWKNKVYYHRRSVAETAMFRTKSLQGGHLSLRDYNAQVGEAMAMVKALNRMTLLGMPDSTRSA